MSKLNEFIKKSRLLNFRNITGAWHRQKKRHKMTRGIGYEYVFVFIYLHSFLVKKKFLLKLEMPNMFTMKKANSKDATRDREYTHYRLRCFIRKQTVYGRGTRKSFGEREEVTRAFNLFGVMSSGSALGIKGHIRPPGEKFLHASELASQMYHGVSYSRTLFHNEMSTLWRVHGAVTETHISINWRKSVCSLLSAAIVGFGFQCKAIHCNPIPLSMKVRVRRNISLFSKNIRKQIEPFSKYFGILFEKEQNNWSHTHPQWHNPHLVAFFCSVFEKT